MPLHLIPAGHVGTVVTALEMRGRPALAGAASSLRIRQWSDVDLPAYRALFRAVGARWLWYSRLEMGDAELLQALGEVHVVEDGEGAAVGFVELDMADRRTARIRFLGLVPDLAGRGHGRWMIGRALALAWRPGVERVALYTCSLDHPAALPAYLRAGFQAVDRSFESFPDPRRSGLLPPGCAPQVPIID